MANEGAKRAVHAALRSVLGPLLAERGFVGKLPHWHRARDDGAAWVVSIQHDRYGGGVRAELGWVPPVKVFPALDRRPRVRPGITAWDVSPVFTKSVPGSDFVSYERNPARAAKQVTDAIGKHVPKWFQANELLASGLPRKKAAELAKLVRTKPWVELWILDHANLAGPRLVLQRLLARARDPYERVQYAASLARHGDRGAQKVLAEVVCAPSDDPEEALAAAQELARIHRWPFRWSASSVSKIKARVAGLL